MPENSLDRVLRLAGGRVKGHYASRLGRRFFVHEHSRRGEDGKGKGAEGKGGKVDVEAAVQAAFLRGERPTAVTLPKADARKIIRAIEEHVAQANDHLDFREAWVRAGEPKLARAANEAVKIHMRSAEKLYKFLAGDGTLADYAEYADLVKDLRG